MTLAQRLLLATAILTIASTATVGYGVRDAWRRTEERRFQAEFQAAVGTLRFTLGRDFQELPSLIGPLCAHDELVDSALVGLMAGDLRDRALQLSLRVPERAKAFRLDELWLVNQRGEVLGAHAHGLVGQQNPKLAASIARAAKPAVLRSEPPRAVLATCRRVDPQNPKVWVGLLAARHIDSVLTTIGKVYGMELSLGDLPPKPDAMFERIPAPELGDLTVTATRSRLPLTVAMSELDSTILVIGGFTIALALVAAFLLSRGLARPMVELARQAREAMQSEPPRKIVAHGPREIEESAAAFNRAIEDLTVLRNRLAATERIAAWREIARRVAHEIKNPLAPIRAAIETLRRLRARKDPAFDEYFDEATSTALAEVNRIARIVTEFTEFARMPPPNPSRVDLVELAQKVVALHAGLGACVELSHEPCPEVWADRDQIVQVLTNLVQNAIDAVAKREGGRVDVEVGPGAEGRARVNVRDNGPGLAPEMRERLFLPYATTKANGTGLGLAIAQRLVVEHYGEIGYRDNDGPGASFFFELPVEGPTSARPQEIPLVPGPPA